MNWLKRCYKRWYWRRRFNKMTPTAQALAKYNGVDPDTLIRRGLL